jgi:hypothetical protein
MVEVVGLEQHPVENSSWEEVDCCWEHYRIPLNDYQTKDKEGEGGEEDFAGSCALAYNHHMIGFAWEGEVGGEGEVDELGEVGEEDFADSCFEENNHHTMIGFAWEGEVGQVGEVDEEDFVVGSCALAYNHQMMIGFVKDWYCDLCIHNYHY